jgi:hypothetical protein
MSREISPTYNIAFTGNLKMTGSKKYLEKNIL